MTAVKQAACSIAAVRRHQTTCRPDEFWTTVWRMWWCQTSGHGDWPQALTERYDGAQPSSDLNISVASLKSTRRRTGSQCNSCRTGEMCSRVDPSAWLTWRLRSVQTAVIEVSCQWRRTKLSCSSPGDWRWMPGLMSLQRHVTKTAVWIWSVGGDSMLSDRLTPRGRPLTTGCQWQRRGRALSRRRRQ